MKLMDYIKELNANVADIASTEKAKKLRHRLLLWGGILLGVGILGVICLVIAFAAVGFSSVGNSAGPNMSIVGIWCGIIPFMFMIPIGAVLLKCGFAILIGGGTAKLLDRTGGYKCSCGNSVKEDEKYCPNCGKAVKKVCNCGAENEMDNQYCTICGKKL